MFLISLQGKESIYEQIRSQIEKFITAGILKPGGKLPSVRNLALELGINPNTVMKAYQELEKNGYIYTLNKKGVFVSGNPVDDTKKKEEDALKILNALKQEGFSREDLHRLVDMTVDKEEIC